MRDTIVCRSPYARDGRGVFIRHARKLDGTPGPVFCRFEDELLINGPVADALYPKTVVGWIALEDAADLVTSGEWKGTMADELCDVPALAAAIANPQVSVDPPLPVVPSLVHNPAMRAESEDPTELQE